MADMMDITMSQILADLEAAFKRDDVDSGPNDAFTIRELVAKSRMSECKVREAVRSGLTAGTWEHVQVRRLAMNNQRRLVDAYRPVPLLRRTTP